MNRRRVTVAAAIVAAVALTGCGAQVGPQPVGPSQTDSSWSASASPTPTEAQTSSGMPADLLGSWVLTWWLDEAGTLSPDLDITLNVTPDGVNGRSACNAYFGSLTADDMGTFRVGVMGATLMGCFDTPEGEAETIYRALLYSVSSWQRTGDVLSLFTDGRETLRFNLAQSQ